MATRLRAPVRRVVAALAIGAAGSVPLGVHATTIDELEAAIAAFRRQVDELRAQSRAAADTPNAPAANVVTGGKTPGSFKLPGSDTSITLGGYVKLDAVLSNPSARRPRLRHAYATLGHFLGGQTWTNFMNPAALPETVDFGGPAGQIFVRMPRTATSGRRRCARRSCSRSPASTTPTVRRPTRTRRRTPRTST